MLSKLLSTSTVILLSTGLAAAQTSSLCNPVKGQCMFACLSTRQACPTNPPKRALLT